MDRKIVYQKTADYLRGKWLNIILVLAGIWGINVLVGLIIGGSTATSMISDMTNTVNYGGSDDEMALRMMNTFLRGTRKNFLLGIIQATVNSLLTAGFVMTLLDSIKKDEPPTFEGLFNNIQEFIIEILIASLIIGTIETVIGLIPIIGWIITIVLTYVFAYVFYIIKEDDEQDVINSIKESAEKTKGHKLNLLMIDLNYYFKPLLVLLLIPLSVVFFAQEWIALGFLFIFGGLIGSIVLAIRYIPYANVARTIYYEETNTTSVYNEDLYSDTLEDDVFDDEFTDD